jgi:phosphopantothenoylcysteine decarboxylase/phosphopantothenate--cysteine ligase
VPRPVLLTAGATRNPVDAIRYLSAHATGRTGVELARRLSDGHEVRLLGSAEACLRGRLAGLPQDRLEEFLGTRDLMARVEANLRARPDSVFLHSAAVGDYEMEAPRADKIPSGADAIELRLVRAPKIVDRVRAWAPDCVLVSFKAAPPGTTPEDLERIARAQLQRTRSDLVFANALGALDTSVLLVGAVETRAFTRREDAVEALLEQVRHA